MSGGFGWLQHRNERPNLKGQKILARYRVQHCKQTFMAVLTLSTFTLFTYSLTISHNLGECSRSRTTNAVAFSAQLIAISSLSALKDRQAWKAVHITEWNGLEKKEKRIRTSALRRAIFSSLLSGSIHWRCMMMNSWSAVKRLNNWNRWRFIKGWLESTRNVMKWLYARSIIKNA